MRLSLGENYMLKKIVLMGFLLVACVSCSAKRSPNVVEKSLGGVRCFFEDIAWYLSND